MEAALDPMAMREWIVGKPLLSAQGGRPDRPFEPVPPAWQDRPAWDYIEHVASRDPEHVIIDDGVMKITYRVLVREVRTLARRLLAAAPLDRPAALLLRNDARFPIVQMAAIAAGLAMVPLDLASPAERKKLLLRESGAGAVITLDDPEIDLSFVPRDVPVFRLGALGRDNDDAPLPPVDRDLDAPVMIGFTSGSTGTAKGIAYSERHVYRIVGQHIATHQINREDVILGIASLSAAGIRDAITAMVTGALLRPLDFKAVGLVEGLRAMREGGVTLLSFIPSYLRMIMQLPGIEASFAHLRVLELGGEVTTAEDIALFRSKLPSTCRISLSFGSTETGVVFRWLVDEVAPGSSVPLGHLVDGRAIAIVDEDDRPVAPGEAGEMIVSDAMLALGYWRAGQLDTSRFTPEPGDPGIRTVRSGDRVRMRPDGLFERAGRVDRMVKINGLQADLAEIESVLKAHPSVADGAVVSPQREGESARLVAFVVSRDAAAPLDRAALRQLVAERAAEHMIPHAIVAIEELPRLHNGKPDLVRLTAMASGDA